MSGNKDIDIKLHCLHKVWRKYCPNRELDNKFIADFVGCTRSYISSQCMSAQRKIMLRRNIGEWLD